MFINNLDYIISYTKSIQLPSMVWSKVNIHKSLYSCVDTSGRDRTTEPRHVETPSISRININADTDIGCIFIFIPVPQSISLNPFCSPALHWFCLETPQHSNLTSSVTESTAEVRSTTQYIRGILISYICLDQTEPYQHDKTSISPWRIKRATRTSISKSHFPSNMWPTWRSTGQTR